jgi:hypothetical protein
MLCSCSPTFWRNLLPPCSAPQMEITYFSCRWLPRYHFHLQSRKTQHILPKHWQQPTSVTLCLKSQDNWHLNPRETSNLKSPWESQRVIFHDVLMDCLRSPVCGLFLQTLYVNTVAKCNWNFDKARNMTHAHHFVLINCPPYTPRIFCDMVTFCSLNMHKYFPCSYNV